MANIKQLTPDNWLEPDPTNGVFGGIPSASDVAASILETRLAKNVPEEVRELFEVARGAMCYGYFYYPLWNLAAEQLFRIAETAVYIRCKDLGSADMKSHFDRDIKFLIEHSPVDAELIDWHAMRYLRNAASHPAQQTIVTPAMAIGILETLASAVDRLFRNRSLDQS